MTIDRDSAAASVAATLEHLQRLGVTHLPAVDREATLQQVAAAFPEWAVESTATTAAPSPSAAAHPSEMRQPASPPGGARGRRQLPKPAPRSTARPSRFAPAAPVDAGPAEYALPVLDVEARRRELEAAAARVSHCTRCPELAYARRQTVYGEGDPAARVCFFGEGPGAEEDRQGRPFVGRSGQLLTKMIEACSFRREDVYILNTVKCRPPGNRNPELSEIAHCREYFEQQFELIQPEYIVCLGLVAAQSLLNTTISIGRLRGTFHRYRSSKVIVTYHPSYLLRTPAAKRAAWEDLQMMLRDMGIDPAQAKRRD
jgi:DNA polymerase